MKILLFYHGGSLNRGCEAIVRSAVGIIQKSMPEAHLGLASMAPDTDRLFEGTLTIHDVRRTTIAKYSLPWLKSALSVKLFRDDSPMHRYQNEALLALIPQYDLFLSIGGDNYCYGEQPWLYVVDREIKKAGKKLILWGASIGPEDLSPAKVSDLKQFDLLLVRETLTQAALQVAGIPNVQLCADGAFTMEKELLPLPEGWLEGNTLGFNYSPLVWQRNPQSKAAALALVQHILATTDMAVCLTPHVIIPGNDDYAVLEEFKSHFSSEPRVILLPNTLNAIQYKGYIARMRFFIGARTHATIAAYSNYVPTLVLGYSIKSKGIAKDLFGYERMVLSIDQIADTDLLIAQFDALLREENELRHALMQRIPEIQALSWSAGDALKRL